MNTVFVVGNREAAKSQCPWAARIVRVDGGYMCFASIADWAVWKSKSESIASQKGVEMKTYTFSDTKTFFADDDDSVFVSAHVLDNADDLGIIGVYVTRDGDVIDDDNIAWCVDNDLAELGIESGPDREALLEAWSVKAREIAARAFADR